MLTFDFITNEDFRTSLQRDVAELESCLEASAWKAAHVMAGSVIEATLIDYVISSGKSTEAAAMKMDFASLVEFCKQNGILSQKTVDLSSVVRAYRNLIHPGRVFRLQERVDKNGALIAKSLVEIIVEEIAAKKRDSYGLTAEQIVRKISSDDSVMSIIHHLLRQTNAVELKRLVMGIVPDAYLGCVMSSNSANWETITENLKKCFRLTFDLVDQPVKIDVCNRYVQVLKEEDEFVVGQYESVFFRGSDIEFIDKRDRSLVKSHYLATLHKSATSELLDVAQGLALHLDDDELRQFTGVIATIVLRLKDDALEGEAVTRLALECYSLPADRKAIVMKRLKELENFYTVRKQSHALEKVSYMLRYLEDDVPF